jgi:glycosyltransferase involved in cell wall biosynthesis
MKVGIIQNVSLNDHRSVHSHNVACELEKRGIDVDLILQKTDDTLQYKSRPYTLIQLPGKTYSIQGQLQFVTASFPVIARGKYDIIHAKNPFSSIFSAVTLQKMGVIPSKIVYDMRGLWIDFGVTSGKISPHLQGILEKIENVLFKRCDHIIAISPQLKEVLCSRGVDKEKISVIFGSGVNIEKVESVPPAKKDTIKTIGYIGTISVVRQSEKIIEAFKKIERKDIRLVMIGPIGEPAIFKEIVLPCDTIVLTGFLPQEKAFSQLKSFDIVVSYHSGDDSIYTVAVPNKIFEYMAADIPIVTTDHPMYTNILENGKTAVLTEQNPEDFARGIEYLLDNVDAARKMAQRARFTVEKYSITGVVDQLESLYKNLLE